MNTLSSSVQWVWAFSVAAQLTVMVVLIGKEQFRKLQFFTFFVALNLSQALFLFLLICFHQSGAPKYIYMAWGSQAIILVAQAFATTEILRLVLGPYQAIWTLGWRLILATSLVDLFFVLALFKGDMAWALMEADRGYHFIFATAVIACLFLFRHYRVPISTVYKTLLAGFCFYSCVEILINTILKNIFTSGSVRYEALWQIVTMGTFTVMQVAWAVVLRKPLPAQQAVVKSLPPAVYDRISPEINLGLRQLNDQLGKFWKVEAPRP